MAGVKKLRKIQLGKETTGGSKVDATTVWRGTGTIEDGLVVMFPEEDVGYLSGLDRACIPKVEAHLSMDETPATFEQSIHIFNAGIVTVSAVDDGTGKKYVYTFPTTSESAIKTYTLEGGDDQQEEEFGYGFVESFTLSGVAGEPVMMSANWIGWVIAPGTFTTTGVTIPTVEEVLTSKGSLYIDAVSGAPGGTIKANTLIEFALNVKTGWQPTYCADGALYFSYHEQVGPEVTLDITFEHNTTSVAEVAAWRAGTARLLRLSFAGTTFTAGTSYSNKILRFDLAGKWEKFEKLGEKDGNDVVKGLFRSRYDPTDTTFANITVVNKVATVP